MTADLVFLIQKFDSENGANLVEEIKVPALREHLENTRTNNQYVDLIGRVFDECRRREKTFGRANHELLITG